MLHSVITPSIPLSQEDIDWAAKLLAEVVESSTQPAVFTRIEQEAIELGLSECERVIARGAATGRVARAVDWFITSVVGVRGGRALADPRLDALRRFSAATRQRQGAIDNDELALLLQAGFSREHASVIASRIAD